MHGGVGDLVIYKGYMILSNWYTNKIIFRIESNIIKFPLGDLAFLIIIIISC